MAGNQVTVIARIKAKLGYDGDVRKELLALAEPTRKEPGCINYDIHLSRDHPCLFMIHENWQSEKDDISACRAIFVDQRYFVLVVVEGLRH